MADSEHRIKYCLRFGQNVDPLSLSDAFSGGSGVKVAFLIERMCPYCRKIGTVILLERIGYKTKGFGVGSENQISTFLTEEVALEGSGLFGGAAC